MKRLFTYFISLTLLAGSPSAIAQISLSQANIPEPGLTYQNKIIQDTTLNPSQSGINTTWDYSTYFIDVNTLIETYDNPVHTPYASDFPGANMAVNSYFGGYDYFTVTGTTVYYLGFKSATASIKITNQQKIFSLPLTFGTAINNVAVTGTGDGLFGGAPISGTISVTADAWGTLKLNSGTYSNTLRVITDYSLVAELGPGIETYFHMKKYTWYRTGLGAPLMQVSKVDITGATITDIHQKFITVHNVTLGIGIDELTKPAISLSVSPNPASAETHVSLTLDKKSDLTLKVMDLTGRVWKEQRFAQQVGAKEILLDVADLPKGVYILSAHAASAVQERRLIIQ